MIILEGADGALCHINNSRRCAYGYDQRIEAFGENGMLQAGNQRPTTVSVLGRCGDRGAAILSCDFFIERYTPAYLAEIDHFVDCVEHGHAAARGLSATAARRCASPMPRSRACRPARKSRSAEDKHA